MIVLLLLLCSPLLAIEDWIREKMDKFHVCTVASDPHPRLDQLIESCRKHHIELDILGMNLPYEKNGKKLLYMIEYLENFQDDEIVLFLDGYDTLVIADKQVILEKFLRSNHPFIMGAEKNCAPDPDLARFFEPGPTEFRYINTGTYIGYVKNIKAWLAALRPIVIYRCDQYQTILHFLRKLENRNHFVLDVYCEFFLPLFQVYPYEVEIDAKNKTLTCTVTNSRPCVLHANGQAFSIYDRAYRQLITTR